MLCFRRRRPSPPLPRVCGLERANKHKYVLKIRTNQHSISVGSLWETTDKPSLTIRPTAARVGSEIPGRVYILICTILLRTVGKQLPCRLLVVFNEAIAIHGLHHPTITTGSSHHAHRLFTLLCLSCDDTDPEPRRKRKSKRAREERTGSRFSVESCEARSSFYFSSS